MPSRLTAVAAGAAILLGGSAPAATAATDPAGPPSTVTFSTARGDAPHLQPGLHQTQAPEGETQRYASITRPRGGSVAVAIFGDVDASITTANGEDTCSSDSTSLTYGVTGYTFVFVDGSKTERQTFQPDDCTSATDLILQVSADDSDSGDSDSTPTGNPPITFAVTVEPKIADLGSPSRKSQQDEITPPSKSTKGKDETVLSSELAAPTTLTPGSYPVSLKPGALAVARVRVGWGQRLAASVDAPRNGTNFAPSMSLDMQIEAFSPQWAVTGGGDRTASLYEQEATEQTASTYTAPVNPANRSLDFGDVGDVGTDKAQWATTAGWYYLVVRVAADDEDGPQPTKMLPARLNIQVTGTPTDGPKYVNAAGTPVAAPPATQMSQGGSTDSGSSTATILRVVGTVVVLVLAGGVFVLLRRRA